MFHIIIGITSIDITSCSSTSYLCGNSDILDLAELFQYSQLYHISLSSVPKRNNTYLELRLPVPTNLQHVSKALDLSNAEASALDILAAYDPSWEDTKDEIRLKRFTEGWTSTLLKAKRNIPGKSKAEIEADAIFVRGYGVGTTSFIDRENDIKTHNQLSEYDIVNLEAVVTEFISDIPIQD